MSLIDRAKNISLRPNAEWPVIAGEPATVGSLYAGYVMPLAAINPIALFIGLSIIGISIPFVGTYRTPFFSGISQAILSFVLVLLGIALMAFIVNALAPTFNARKSFPDAVKLVAYSATPGFIAGVLSIFPPLAMLEILFALWGLYLFYTGLPILMQTTRERALPYTVVSMVCAFVVGLVLSMCIGVAMGVTRMATGGVFGPHAVYGAAAPDADEAQAKAVVAGAIGSAMGGSDADKKQAADVVNSVTQAAKESDAANKSGDADAQAQAGANILKSFVTGGKEVKTVPREALKALLPDSVAGLSRTGAESKSGTFAGIAGSGASATYGDGNGRSISLGLADMGNMGGLAMLANLAANVASSDSDEGYEKTVEIGGRKVHEKWTNAGKHSELFEIVEGRFAVSVDGTGVDMDTALQALGSVDAARVAALRP